jgi:opacity protein-like surface antigen
VRRTTVPLVLIMALGVVGLGASRVWGEAFIHLYGGAADTKSTRVTAAHQDCTGSFFFVSFCSPETKATRDVDFDTSATFGIRGGYWFEPVPWVGVAGDLSTFRAEGDEAKFHLIPVSILVMLRLPLLTTDEAPGGRLHPYLGLGPSLVYQKATVDYRPEVDRKVKLSSVEIGFDARLGLAWQFHRRVGLFAEYRFTYVPIDEEDDSGFNASTERVDARLTTHHVLVGVSIRF